MPTLQTQHRILESAVALFNEYGTAAVSTNRIAARCRISKGNLHYHFPTKQTVILAIFQQMVDEMDASWYHDHLQPSIGHMAEMFARHALLVQRYRFFYREMPQLLRSDALLMRRYRENRTKRMRALERFFMALDHHEGTRLQGDHELIRSLIRSTWILCDHWLNLLEPVERTIDERSILAGYELVLDVLRPYLTTDERRVRSESRTTIHRYLESEAFRRTARLAAACGP